jgi:tetratricopeptide (TPR) repeat protein
MRRIETYLLGGMVFLVSLAACNQHTSSPTSIRSEQEQLIQKALQAQEADSILLYSGQVLPKLDDPVIKKQLLLLRVRALYRRGNLESALVEGLQAQLLTASEPDSLDAQIQFALAEVHTFLGQYDEALKGFQKAAESFDRLGNRIGYGNCLNSIALVYHRIDDQEKTLEYDQQAREVWAEIDYPRGEAASLTTRGYVASRQGAFAEALQYLHQAQAIYQSLNDESRYANSFLNIGAVYLDQGELEKAEQAISQSLALSPDQPFIAIYVDGLNKLGQVYTRQGKYTLARDTFYAGLRIAEQIQDRALLAEFYLHLSELFSQQGDFDRAYRFQEKFTEQRDSIFFNQRALRIAEYEVIYQTEEIAKQNRALLAENQRRRQLVVVLSIMTLFTLVIIFLTVSRFRIRLKLMRQQKELKEREAQLRSEENAKLQLDIQHKRNELSSVTLHLYQKNESLNQLIREVDKLERQLASQKPSGLRDLKKAINRNLNLEEDWDRFRLHFDQVHEGFIEKIAADYPKLSPLDLRHCAYIRMNLSTKEISRLMNIAPGSVQKARVRMKRKLELDKDTDLFDFIRHF